MDLHFLRDHRFLDARWDEVRPLVRHLFPEYAWDKVRSHTLRHIEHEREAGRDRRDLDEFFFTYPPMRLVEQAHEDAAGMLFMSEILEGVAFRAAQALCALAGLIRLEGNTPTCAMLRDAFYELWGEFSQFGYGHGYGQGDFRADLVMLLSSANVFDLIPDKDWPQKMLAYFTGEIHPWLQQPLREMYPEVIQVLGGDPGVDEATAQRNSILSGVLDLEARSARLDDLCSGLTGNAHDQRRDSLPEVRPALRWARTRSTDDRELSPGSDLFNLPYHLIRVKCGHLWITLHRPKVYEPLHAIVLHFLITLDMRTLIVQAMTPGQPFNAREAAMMCGITPYTATMALGQMIREGLVEFDRGAELAWNHPGQTYVLNPQARILAGGR